MGLMLMLGRTPADFGIAPPLGQLATDRQPQVHDHVRVMPRSLHSCNCQRRLKTTYHYSPEDIQVYVQPPCSISVVACLTLEDMNHCVATFTWTLAGNRRPSKSSYPLAFKSARLAKLPKPTGNSLIEH